MNEIDTMKPLEAVRLADGAVLSAELQAEEGEDKFTLRVRLDGDCHTGSRWFSRDGTHIRGEYRLRNIPESAVVDWSGELESTTDYGKTFLPTELLEHDRRDNTYRVAPCGHTAFWVNPDGRSSDRKEGWYVRNTPAEPTPVVPEVDTTKPVQFETNAYGWVPAENVQVSPDGKFYTGFIRERDRWSGLVRMAHAVRNKPPEPTIIESKLFVNINEHGAYGYADRDVAVLSAAGGKYLKVAFPLSHRFTVHDGGEVVAEIVEGGGN